ncbi:retinol dehydrogenase 13-like [Zerene cesonia]|uniref:retinol dehydrogenase 13-like n=1 Tax=Zerene cesonia TaxID=33412 RepID=UPI0018E54E85|nr:retinol dehydrogenase 13-like [Zerene cesonia]
MCYSTKKLREKTVLITGGTAGLGLEIAKDLAVREARVIIACPFEDEGEAAKKEILKYSRNSEVIYRHLDLSSLASIRQFACDILEKESRLDILVNNAGVCMVDDHLTSDGMSYAMQVNYYGHFLLTLLLLPLLKKTGTDGGPARIINMSSLSHRRASTNIDNYNAISHWSTTYFNSKLSLVLFTRELKRRLKTFNVVINCADPGIVSTGIYNHTKNVFAQIFIYIMLLFARSPLEGAQTAIFLAVDDAGLATGKYFANCKQKDASRKAFDESVAMRLWNQSVKLVRLTNEELSAIFEVKKYLFR